MNQSRAMAWWLFALSAPVAVMVVSGGWVRLTRSGLSMVEWHVATGVLLPSRRFISRCRPLLVAATLRQNPRHTGRTP